MADIQNTEGSGASREITPRERAIYREEYRHGADLFQKALNQYSKSSDMFQKEEFKEVMDNMMQVMNETARALKESGLKSHNKKIAEDYAAFQDQPNSNNLKKLDKDLDQAKKST